MTPSTQIFYGLVFEDDTHPWGDKDPYYWWSERNIPKPKSQDEEVLTQWRNDCLNFSSRSLVECGHLGSGKSPLHTVHIKASLVYVANVDWKPVDLPELIDRYSPEWDRAIRDFCIRSGVTWDADRAGWKVSA